MKQLFIILLSLFCLQECKAQKAVVANLRENIAYIGIPNPLGILVEGYKWDEFEATTYNGKIEKDEDESSYLYYPKIVGKSFIFLKSKKGDTLGICEYRTKHLPNPVAEVLGQSTGMMYKNRLLVAPGIYCQLDNFDFDIRFIIKKYSIAIIRNDSAVYMKSDIFGYAFDNDIKEEFSKTKSGDKLIFYGIQCVGPDKIIRDLSPIEFTITE